MAQNAAFTQCFNQDWRITYVNLTVSVSGVTSLGVMIYERIPKHHLEMTLEEVPKMIVYHS